MQIGLDTRHAVTVEELPVKLARLLCSLDGSTRLAVLLDRAGRDHASLLCQVLGELAERGLLEDAAGTTPRTSPGDIALWALRSGHPPEALAAGYAHAAIVVRGDGKLAVAVATLLAAAGIGHVVPETAGTVSEQDVGSGLLAGDIGNRRRPAVVEAIRRANPATSTSTLPAMRTPDLVLLTDAVVPPPELIDRLMCDHLPHLPVRVRDGIGIVGPLVLPGRTSCLHCADLHRATLDRCWPRVANQLAGKQQFADPSSIQATAALASGQVLRTVSPAHRPSPLWNATLELDVYTGTTRHRTWSPHPRCECRAALT